MRTNLNSLGLCTDTFFSRFSLWNGRKFCPSFSSFPYLISKFICYEILDLFNIFLHQCGDIEVNPGPRQSGKYTGSNFISNMN